MQDVYVHRDRNKERTTASQQVKKFLENFMLLYFHFMASFLPAQT